MRVLGKKADKGEYTERRLQARMQGIEKVGYMSWRNRGGECGRGPAGGGKFYLVISIVDFYCYAEVFESQKIALACFWIMVIVTPNQYSQVYDIVSSHTLFKTWSLNSTGISQGKVCKYSIIAIWPVAASPHVRVWSAWLTAGYRAYLVCRISWKNVWYQGSHFHASYSPARL